MLKNRGFTRMCKWLDSTALRIVAFALAIFPVLALVEVFGQANAGSISGTVRDSSGAVIVGAAVTVTSTGTGAERTVETGGTGGYTVPALLPGIYDVKISHSGFATYSRRVEVTVGGQTTLDAELSVGNQSTTVEVSAEAATQVNTQTQELSQMVSANEVAQLPSLTRNPYDFVATAGNVSNGDRTAQGGDQNTTGRGVGFSINGQRTSSTEVLLDGVENTDLFKAQYGEQIPIDGVQEFRIITSNFDAQYGRAGGGIVNLTTKSGTNSFHGSAWEFNRLAAYTANTYANNSVHAPKGGYTRNQFGYSFGGPLIKNKLFIFQTTEWLKVRSNAVLQAYVPTPQFLALTPANVQAYFKSYGQNNFTFASTLTQAQVAAASGTRPGGPFSTIPASTPVAGLVNFTAPTDAGGGVPTNTYRPLGRIDFNLSDRTSMFFRYALENIDDFTGANFASPYSKYNVGQSQYNNSGLYSISHAFSPNFVSTSKISFSRLNVVQTYDSSVVNVPELFITSGASLNNIPVQLPGLWAQFAGSGGEPYGGPQNTYQGFQDFAKIKGSHIIRFGGNFHYIQSNRAYGAYAQGIEQLGTSSSQGWNNIVAGNLALFQAAIYPQGKLPCVANPNRTLQVTPACTLTLPATSPSFSRSYRFKDWAGYVSDTWRVTARLTLNLGTRYEHYGVQHNNVQTLDSNFYFGAGSNIYQKVRNGQISLAPKGPVGQMWAPDWGTIAPRIGFAYDVFGDGKTSVRGGWGISYERNFGNVTFNVIQNPPNYASVQLTPAVLGTTIPVTTNNFGPFGGSTGSVPLRPSSLRHVAQNINTAQTQFYSLAVERELTRATVLALEYAGAHGVHLYDIAAYNHLGGGQVYLGDPLAGGLTRSNMQYTGINTRGSGGTSRYNALNVRLQTTNLHNTGLSLVSNYTWARSMDDLSSTFSDSTGGASNGIGNLGYLDPRNPKLDWGSSDYDIRHRLTASAIWETPWYRTGKGVLRQVLGGYTLVPVFTVRTGVPFSIFDTTNSLNAGSGYGIPRYVPTGAISSFHTGSAVATAPNNFIVLILPPGLTTPFNSVLGVSDFGPFPANMTRRNSFRGPGAWNADFAVAKSFAVTERVRLEFRAEGFDIFNHHNLYVNALTLDNANFSPLPVKVTALKGGLGTNNVSGVAHDERRFGQFSLRVAF